MASWDLRRLQQSLEKKTPNSLYMIFGEELYLVDESIKVIKENVLREGAVDFNYDCFYGTEVAPSQIRDTVEMLPMMCERRLVILKSAQQLKEKDWEALIPILERPVDSCVFVIVADKLDKRKKYVKQIQKNGVLVELKRPFDNQVPVWIDYIAYNNNLKLSKAAIDMLHQLVGANLSEINNELRKLSQYVGENTNVDVDTVLKVVSKARIDSIFDLTDAIGRKDRAAALTCLANLLEHGQSEVAAVSLILRHVRILAQLQEGLRSGLGSAKLSSKIGVPQFFLKKYMGQCKLWNDDKIAKTISVLHDTDKALKSSPLSSHIWLENFIVKTC